MGNEIEDQVVLFSVFRKVFPGVIDDMVGTQGTHEIQLLGIVHAGNLRAMQFGKLYGKGTGTSSCPVDQNLLSILDLSLVANPLQGDHARLWNGGCLRKGQ